MLLQMTRFHSFLWMNSILTHTHTHTHTHILEYIYTCNRYTHNRIYRICMYICTDIHTTSFLSIYLLMDTLLTSLFFIPTSWLVLLSLAKGQGFCNRMMDVLTSWGTKTEHCGERDSPRWFGSLLVVNSYHPLMLEMLLPCRESLSLNFGNPGSSTIWHLW